MYIDNLIIEVTRFCNMNCKHCLRGTRQRKKFNTNMLDNIFNGVDYVSVITFTGGEPLTQVNTIIEILDYIEQNNIAIGGFYIVSNGTIYSKKLMVCLDYFYNHYVQEKEICGFEISQDQYHDNNYIKQNNILKYAELKEYYGYEFINMEGRKKIYSLIIEGNAKSNGYTGRFSQFPNGFPKEDDLDNYYDMQIYVAANGNVISNCDLSFDNVDKYSFGNVNDESLKSIYERNIKEKIQAIVLE